MKFEFWSPTIVMLDILFITNVIPKDFVHMSGDVIKFCNVTSLTNLDLLESCRHPL